MSNNDVKTEEISKNFSFSDYSENLVTENKPSNISAQEENPLIPVELDQDNFVYINNFMENGKQVIFSQSSFIQTPEEEDEASKLVKECMGEDFDAMPRPCGPKLLVKLHQRIGTIKKGGKDTGIIVSEATTEEDKYRSAVGLVVAVGPRGYNGKRFNVGGAYAKVGDFVVFPINAGSKISYRGHKMRTLFDDNIDCVIQSPDDVDFDY